MGDFLSLPPLSAAETASQLAACNRETARFGLSLSDGEIRALALSRGEALRRAGRVEFGGGILPKLARAFCDSPYLQQTEYAAALETLQELFYQLKSESGERLSDDALLTAMRRAYDGPAGGAAESIPDVGVLELCRNARLGRRPKTGGEEEKDDETADGE